jgi:asparagine synthase (glutamine-hydrolysing)
MARRLAPVRLTANFGGELLRGDRAFKSIMPQGAFVTPALKPYLSEAEETFAEVEATDPVTFALFQQAPSQGYGRLAIERSQVVLRTPFMDNDLIWLVYRAPPELLKGTTLSVALISRYNPHLLNIPTDRGFLWNDSPLGSLVRRFHREALFKAEYWSTHGMPSWLAGIAGPEMRRALEKHLAGRHKFQHFSIWTRERLGVYLTEVLLDGISDLAEFFDRQEVEAMVRQHVEGRRNYLGELDKLVTITLARQSLFRTSSKRGDSSPPPRPRQISVP